MNQEEELKRCGYCGKDADHQHSGRTHGWACGNCCSYHGMLTFPDVPEGIYEWVGEMFEAHAKEIAESAKLRDRCNVLAALTNACDDRAEKAEAENHRMRELLRKSQEILVGRRRASSTRLQITKEIEAFLAEGK